MDTEAEIRRVAKLLDTEIHVAGSTKRAVERKLGVAAGYLTKVIKGGLELRVRHILDVAEATGFDVAEFFQKAFPPKNLVPGGGREPAVGPSQIAEVEARLGGRIDRVETSLETKLDEIRETLTEVRQALPQPQTPAAPRRAAAGNPQAAGRAAAPRRARPPRR